MANRHGEFVWYELMTTDSDAAARFYQAVVGWRVGAAPPPPEMDYRLIEAGDGPVAGLMRIDADMAAQGARPMWLGYIGVDDVDAAAAEIARRGGAIHIAPRDIPDVGRFAMAADPQGALFYVMRGASDEASTAFAACIAGHCGWNELSTTDQQGAHAFYEPLFGWTSPEAMPMGAMGDYRFLMAGDLRIGATMEQQDRPSAWRCYFRVPSIAAAMAALKAGGGTVTSGPHQVPGGDHVVIGADPQGAAFALVGGE